MLLPSHFMTICHFFKQYHHKANLRDLIAVTGLVILLKLDQNHRLISLCDLEIWWMTSKNNRAPLLYYIKLCASFQIHWWIQTGVTVQKCSIRVKIGDFLSHVTLKFDGWPWKIIGHLFYTTLSFVQHFKAIGIFKLELQSGNAQVGSKLAIFCPGWLWKLMYDFEKAIGHLFYTTSSFVHHFKSIGEVKLEFTAWKCSSQIKIGDFFVPHDLENWRMTLKNNRAALLCCFNLCDSFYSQWWIQTGVIVRKLPIWVKINDFFLAVWPWNLTDDLEEH